MDNSQGNRYVYWTCIGRCMDNSQGNRYVYWACIGRCMDSSHRNRSEQSPVIGSPQSPASEVKRAVSPDLENARDVPVLHRVGFFFLSIEIVFLGIAITLIAAHCFQTGFAVSQPLKQHHPPAPVPSREVLAALVELHGAYDVGWG